VTVVLPLGIATGVTARIANIQNIVGSQGNDLLVGDANPNVLIGGTGRNVFIGGAGTDQLTGGGGFNLLIGGTTGYDTNLTALQDLKQYWDNPSATTLDQLVYPLQIQNGVTVSGQHLILNQTTVQNNNALDSLIGGGGPNWFIADSDDIINQGNGPGPNDRLTRI
jgi:hypothetical protein